MLNETVFVSFLRCAQKLARDQLRKSILEGGFLDVVFLDSLLLRHTLQEGGSETLFFRQHNTKAVKYYLFCSFQWREAPRMIPGGHKPFSKNF